MARRSEWGLLAQRGGLDREPGQKPASLMRSPWKCRGTGIRSSGVLVLVLVLVLMKIKREGGGGR